MFEPQLRRLYRRFVVLGILSTCLILVSFFYPIENVSACNGNCPIRYCLEACASAEQDCIAGCNNYQPCIDDCNLYRQLCESSCF